MHVSVVIPTCNRAHTLRRALDSVLAQTLAPAEIIVVDDGSTDGTAELLRKRYASVRCLRQANRGVSSARNRGIAAAAHDWIALLDSDDAWAPQRLQSQARALREQPRHLLCHSDEIWYRDSRRVNPMRKHRKHGGYIFEQCLPRCVISPSTVLMHRDLLREVGTFDERLPACEDYELWLRVCRRHRVLLVREPLAIRHGGHRDQLSRRFWGMDRFRVQALAGLLRLELDPAQERAVYRTLLTKLTILLGGARKHGNEALLQRFAPLYERCRAALPHRDSA